MARYSGIKLDFVLDRSLLMRVVAGEAHVVFFRILDFLRPVLALLQSTRNLIMANQAVIRLKEILRLFSYLFRVRMKRFLLSVVVAILAGGLSMDRRMEFLGVYPPRSLGRGRAPPEEEDKKKACKERFLFSPGAVGVLSNHIKVRVII
jgi:hypothetical protein